MLGRTATAFNIAFVLCRQTDNATSTVCYYQILSQPDVMNWGIE